MQKFTRSLFAVGAVLGLAACGDDVSVTPPTPAPAATIASVTVVPATISIALGEKVILTASVTTTAGTGTPATTVTWSSASAAIASVSASGEVTGVAAGTTTIRATSTLDPGKVGASAVTVRAAPVPVVRSVSVTPTALGLGAGQTATAVASVDRDSPLPGTVTWSTNASSVATVSSAGLITAVAAGTAVITATSTADVTKAASLAVTVSALAQAVTSLTVAPTAASLAVNDVLAIVATAQVATGATAAVFSYTSSNTAVATVSGTGVVTALSPGTAIITSKATSTITVGAVTRTDFLLATTTVTVGARASISIASLTTGNNIPVNLAGVLGQIEATLNINSGAERVEKVEVFINDSLAAGQVFGVNGAPNAPVQLSINTASFNSAYEAKYRNGSATIVAKIYPAGSASPTASNTVAFTLTNPDVVYFDATVGTTGGAFGLNHTGTSAVGQSGANTWWKSGFTFRAHPVSYSGVIASISYNSTSCGASSGLATSFSATFACTGIEGTQNITNVIAVVYPGTYTLTVAPTAMMTVTSVGFVPGFPVFAAVTTREDNVGPTVAAPVFVLGLTSVLTDNWAGSPTTWSALSTDGGVGMTSSSATLLTPTDVSNNAGTFPNLSNPLTLAETITGSGYLVSGAPSADLLLNTGSRGPSSPSFGVDLSVLDAQYSDRPFSALATIFPLLSNGTIYTAAAWLPLDGVTDVVAADAIDTRSGLDNPNAQISTLVRRTASGSTSCTSGATAMATILADNYVQTTTPAQLDCGNSAGSRVGYYTWRASVKDRAGNSKVITSDGTTRLDSVFVAIDEAVPNVTGLGFMTTLYTGGLPATYSISANDDLELKDGQVALNYLGVTPSIIYPYGSAAYTSAAFGAPFDATFSNVINGANLTLGYYIVRWDVTTAAPFVPGGAPSGNVAGFASSGLNSTATASVRDMANQTASLGAVPILNTQISDRVSAPGYAAAMIHFNITSAAGAATVVVQQVGLTSTTTPFCDRIEIFEGAGLIGTPGDPTTVATSLTYRATITASPAITDNGFQRFWTYTSAVLSPAPASGYAVAACFKSGSALLSRLN